MIRQESRKREKTFLHRHLAIIYEGFKKLRLLVQCFYSGELAFLFYALQRNAHAIITRHVLLKLAPRTHKWNGAKIVQRKPRALAALGRPAGNIGLAIKIEWADLGEIRQELWM